MSEPTAPPPPPSEPPSPPSEPAAAPPSGASGNRGVMIVLSYLWILALIPFLVEKEDKEVQWHAKHGLVLTALEFIIWILITAISATGIGCILGLLSPIIFLIFVIIRVICIIKGVGGERFLIPGVSQYADKF